MRKGCAARSRFRVLAPPAGCGRWRVREAVRHTPIVAVFLPGDPIPHVRVHCPPEFLSPYAPTCTCAESLKR